MSALAGLVGRFVALTAMRARHKYPASLRAPFGRKFISRVMLDELDFETPAAYRYLEELRVRTAADTAKMRREYTPQLSSLTHWACHPQADTSQHTARKDVAH